MDFYSNSVGFKHEEKTVGEYFIEKELNGRLTHYETLNEAKKFRNLAIAKKAYDDIITATKGDGPVCLHPEDLLALHGKARRAAISVFDCSRVPPEENDKDKSDFIGDLDKRWHELLAQNENTNESAVGKAYDEYVNIMNEACGIQPCMSPIDLKRRHDDAYVRAVEYFKAKRNNFPDKPPGAESRQDSYKAMLLQKIETQYEQLKKSNVKNADNAVKDAISVYTKHMKSVCGATLPCLHPDLFEYEHNKAETKALNEYRSKVTLDGPGVLQSENEGLILEGIKQAKADFNQINILNNRSAMASSYNSYCSAMDMLCGNARLTPEELEKAQNYATRLAVTSFKDKRRNENIEVLVACDPDEYMDRLNKDMMNRFEYYTMMNNKNPESPNTMSLLANRLETAAVATGVAFLAGGVIGGILKIGTTASWGSVLRASTKGAGYAASAAVTVWNFISGSGNEPQQQQQCQSDPRNNNKGN